MPAPDFSWGMWILSWGAWDLAPWPGIKPQPFALGTGSLSHWTTTSGVRNREEACVAGGNAWGGGWEALGPIVQGPVGHEDFGFWPEWDGVHRGFWAEERRDLTRLRNLLFWLCWVFVVVHGLSSCGMWDFSCPTRDQTHVLCIGSGFLTTGPPGKSLYTTPSTVIIIHVFTWSINSMSTRGVSGIFPAPKAEPGIQ